MALLVISGNMVMTYKYPMDNWTPPAFLTMATWITLLLCIMRVIEMTADEEILNTFQEDLMPYLTNNHQKTRMQEYLDPHKPKNCIGERCAGSDSV